MFSSGCDNPSGGEASGDAADAAEAADASEAASADAGSSSSSSGMDTQTTADTSSTTADTSASDTGSSSDATESESTTASDPAALGELCMANEDCESQKCASVRGMGGQVRMICSECVDATDCRDSGAGFECAFDRAKGWSTCTTGELGDPCQDAASCMDGLHCAALLGDRKVCSRCATDEHCTDEAAPICSLVGSIGGMGGSLARECIAEGSIENNSICDIEGNGDIACAGYCVKFETMMGGFEIGICGECRPDEASDCGDEQTCQEPSIGMMGIEGSVCVDN